MFQHLWVQGLATICVSPSLSKQFICQPSIYAHSASQKAANWRAQTLICWLQNLWQICSLYFFDVFLHLATWPCLPQKTPQAPQARQNLKSINIVSINISEAWIAPSFIHQLCQPALTFKKPHNCTLEASYAWPSHGTS